MTDAEGSGRLPEKGSPVDELLERIDTARAGDLDWKGGRAFSLVYNSGDEAHEAVLHAVADRYLHENALNPFRYPSLLQMELDLVAMGADLFGGVPDAGAVTAGGSMSIFCAVQVARGHARADMGIAEPQVLAPETAHPAFAKACDLLDIELVTVPVEADGRIAPARLAEAITDRTALLVASAACYPFGVIDPVAEVAALAAERNLLCHVDACLGGFLLPFWQELGQPVPAWDLSVPGVTSLSADIHKYGYAFKGASLVLYRDRDLLKHQHFWYDDWPGGLYASSTPAGTRPAPPIAGAWAALVHLGREGFVRLTRQVLEAHTAFLAGIAGIDGAVVDPVPDISVFQVTTPGRSHDAVGDQMDARGWNLDRQQGGLHVMLSPYHAQVAGQFVADLGEAVAAVPETEDAPTSSSVSTYGGIAEAGERSRAARVAQAEVIVGAVLCGGASRRMGRDKALIEVDGAALARRVADALRAGGCERVLAVGGDAAALAALGLEPVADRWPGEGPLGGLAAALGTAADDDVLVLAPCDLLHRSGATVEALRRALAAAPPVEAVCVRSGARVQWLPSAWRVSTGLADRVAALVDGGARRLDAVADLVGARALDLEPRAVADADVPDDLS